MVKEHLVYGSKTELIRAVAKRFLTLVEQELTKRPEVHIVLTGGSVGIGVLAQAAQLLDDTEIDWYRVHFWWGDERWLPLGDAERNDAQAQEAFLDGLGLPPENLHPFASSDAGYSLVEAEAAMNQELANFAAAGQSHPEFSLCFLGVGPDAHIASLFPGLPQIHHDTLGTVAVIDSPKPPSERLSFTLPLINSAERIWLVMAGADKAEALQAAVGPVEAAQYPVSAVAGVMETLLFSDRDAAGA